MSISEWEKKQKKNSKPTPPAEPKEIPDGILLRCDNCNEHVFINELVKNNRVCPKCDFHFRISPSERIELLIDEGTFAQFDAGLCSSDPLSFEANKSYNESLKTAQEKTKLKEAIVTGEGKIDGFPVIIAVMSFDFIGGSMGSVVGEKVTRAVEKALKKKLPLVIVSASGGARMQEGMLSLMQMAKVSAAIKRYEDKKLPFISILTHPTTGGVTASFASLGDIIIAEPGALIGFTGPRVIEQTIREKLPKGFQRSEFMLEHGLVDMVVHRNELKDTLAQLLGYMLKEVPANG